MDANPTIREIVEQYLKEHGYGGLTSGDPLVPCACEIADLIPCAEWAGFCQAGYRVEGCTEECGEGCAFHIVLDKPNESNETTEA